MSEIFSSGALNNKQTNKADPPFLSCLCRRGCASSSVDQKVSSSGLPEAYCSHTHLTYPDYRSVYIGVREINVVKFQVISYNDIVEYVFTDDQRG